MDEEHSVEHLFGTSQPNKKRPRTDDPLNDWTTGDLYDGAPQFYNSYSDMPFSLTDSGGIKPNIEDDFELEPSMSFFPEPQQWYHQTPAAAPPPVQYQPSPMAISPQMGAPTPMFSPPTPVTPMTPTPMSPMTPMTPAQNETTVLTPVTPLQFTPKASEVSVFLSVTHQQFLAQKVCPIQSSFLSTQG
jgi:hypothetical protein